MASNFSTIGLPVASKEDFKALAHRVAPLAERFAAPSGGYLRWSDPSGAELWLQSNTKNELIGATPHYTGRSTVRVALTSRLSLPGDGELDGSFHGWADPPGDEPDTGCYRFMFEAPDFQLHDALSLPKQTDVQIAAFAHNIIAFDTVTAYDANQTDDLKFASQSFIPSGLFAPDFDAAAKPQPRAIFNGHVLASEKKTNALTGHSFYWALVETLGGAYDVVIDSSLLPSEPVVGGVLSGSFWLSGRILDRS